MGAAGQGSRAAAGAERSAGWPCRGRLPQGRLCRPPQRVLWQWPVPVHLPEPAVKPRSLHALGQSSISCPDSSVVSVLLASPSQGLLQFCPIGTLQTDKLLRAHEVPWMTRVNSSQQTCVLFFRVQSSPSEAGQQAAAAGALPLPPKR